MPRRSNTFQRVIYAIQSQLTDCATVLQSQMLARRDTGDEAEVDIVVESTVGGHPIRIGIECKDSSRRATVEWVHQIVGKHASLPLDKSVLVCSAGYTAGAKRHAAAIGLELLQIEEAENFHWSDLIEDVRNLRLGEFQFHTRSVNIDYSFRVDFKPGVPTDLISPTGDRYRVIRLAIDVVAEFTDTALALTVGRYAGSLVAYGSSKNVFTDSTDRNQEAVVTLGRRKDGTSFASLVVPRFKGETDRVLVMDLESVLSDERD